MPFVPLLLLQDENEVLIEAALHHYPVHSPWEVDVGGQKDDILSHECCDGLVSGQEVVEDHIQVPPLPRARGAGAGAGIRPQRAELFVETLGGVVHLLPTTRPDILARELNAVRHFFHGEVTDASQGTPAAGTTLDFLLAECANDVARVALVDDWREGVIKTHRTLE